MFSEINNAPVTQFIAAMEARDVDYEAYVSNFASSLLLPPRNVPNAPSISTFPLVPLDHIDLQNYERHFNDCVLMDCEVQRLEFQSYNLFGVPLRAFDPECQTFTLHVPGLRENAPKVVYGDSVFLRQLLFEPGSSLPRGMDAWINHGGRQRGKFS